MAIASALFSDTGIGYPKTSPSNIDSTNLFNIRLVDINNKLSTTIV